MKTKLLLLSAALGLVAGSSLASPFSVGNLLVSRVGNGTDVLVNTGNPISILEFTTGGSLVQTINIPDTALQWSGTATSEGAISLSADRSLLTVVGYNPPFSGTGSLPSRTDAQAPRAFLNIDMNGNVGSVTQIGAYSGNNIRSGVATSTGTYFAGGTTGTVYRDVANTTIQSTITNTRVVNIFNGNLYFSTGSGTNGIYGFTGTPTAASTPTLLIPTSGPYDFAFNDTGTVAYVARDTSPGTIERWAFDGTTWNLTHSSGAVGAVTGLAVEWGSGSDTIYTVNPTTLRSLTFDGTSFGAVTDLATAGTNYAFRGLEIVAIPEPGVAALLLIGAGIVFRFSRRRN